MKMLNLKWRNCTMDIDKLNKIIDQVITPEMDEIIQTQELIGMRISGGIDSAFMTFLMMSRYLIRTYYLLNV